MCKALLKIIQSLVYKAHKFKQRFSTNGVGTGKNERVPKSYSLMPKHDANAWILYLSINWLCWNCIVES